MVIKELETVVLKRDVDDHGLRRGDIGAIVHCHNNADAFEVEFVDGEGESLALLTLTHKDVRPIRHREILHVREMMAA